MRPRKHSRWHLAIGRGRVEHRHLIERRRKAEARPFNEEDNVVLMPISISDECTVGIKPPKPASILVTEAPGVPQEYGCPRPCVCGIVVNRRQAQNSNSSAYFHAVESLAL